QNPTHQYTEPGWYTVTLTITDLDGDSDTLTLVDFIHVLAKSPPAAPIIWIDGPGIDYDGLVHLKWAPVQYADGYYIFKSVSEIDEVVIASLVPVYVIENASLADYYETIEADGIYYFAVIAYNSIGNSSISNCVFVEVSLGDNNTPEKSIPGYSLFFTLLFLCLGVSFLSIVFQLLYWRPRK
ncbi:MAG: PKD domain-containing protein, partial [Promethearchaeota archaeon]